MIPALLVPSVRPRALIRAGTLTNGTQQFTLRAYLIGGGYTDSPSGVSWSSSVPSIASISSTGLATLTGQSGTTTIAATLSGVRYTTTLTGVPLTPAQLKAAYNAIPGATMFQVYQRGLQQTPGGAGITAWDDAALPGQGKHWRPSPETPSGTAIGGDGGTSIVSKGLELPASVMDGIIAQCHADTASLASNPTPDGLGLYELFADHTAGLFIGGCGKFLTNTNTLSLGESGPNFYQLNGDQFSLWATLYDPLSGTNGAMTYPVGSPRMRWGWWLVDTPNGIAGAQTYVVERYGRDLFHRKKFFTGAPSALVSGRRLRLLGPDGGNVSDVYDEQNLIYIGGGRETKAHNKLINDYIKAIWPDTWEDTLRPHLVIGDGDSFKEGVDYPIPGGFPADSIGIAHDLLLGNATLGLPRLANCAFYTTALSGDTMAQLQYPMAQLVADMDFTTRDVVVTWTNEVLNGGTSAQMNYTANFLKQSDPKIRSVEDDITYNAASNQSNYPSVNAAIDASVPQYAESVIHLTHASTSGFGMPWLAHNFKDGTTAAWPTGQNPLVWAGNHPTGIWYRYAAAFWQAGILKTLGDSVSARAIKTVPLADHFDFTLGAGTQSTTYTDYNYDDLPLVGKTRTYSVVILDGNGLPVADTSIATVDASGVVTAVGSGHAMLQAVSNDGNAAFVDINVSTTVSDTFTRADSAVTLGNAETGQAWSSLGGTWGISSNQAYYVTGSSANNIYAVVDSGKADTTIQVTFSAYDATGEPRICWRAVDLNNLWIVSTGSPTSTVYKRVAGTYNSVTTFTHTWAAGDVVTIVTSGNNHTVKVNGTQVATFTDAFQATATKHGIGQFQIGAGTNRYDNFSVL